MEPGRPRPGSSAKNLDRAATLGGLFDFAQGMLSAAPRVVFVVYVAFMVCHDAVCRAPVAH